MSNPQHRPHTGDRDRGAARRGLIAALIAAPSFVIAGACPVLLGYGDLGAVGVAAWCVTVAVGAGWLISRA